MKTTDSTPIRFASIGSISCGTLNPCHLIPCFASALAHEVARNRGFLAARGDLEKMERLIADAEGDVDAMSDEERAELLNDLEWALDVFSAPFCTFGAHEGDGACFGYWPNIDAAREDCDFVSSKRQEYPDADFRGYWLHISDHGNVTLYERFADEADFEVWSLV